MSPTVNTRSNRLELIARDADRHTRKAFRLASRGARFSARAEFVRALRLIAQGLDSERQCRAYSEALRSGLRAIEEVEDFIPTGSQLESDLRMREIIDRHRTTILKKYLRRPSQTTRPGDQAGWSSQPPAPALPTPMEAVDTYLRYAQEQLSIAAGGEIAGSMALHGLGKLYAGRKGAELDISGSQAIACFKSATFVCPQNYLAQNDLGVLLARTGRAGKACQVFEKSITLTPRPETMANLAAVYTSIGRKAEAQQIASILAAYKKSTPTCSADIPAVDWVTPEKFSESYAKMPDARQLPPARSPSEPKADQPTARQAERSWPWSWPKR
jgi:tetratricopeptide (TPR) repeat protein